MSPTARTAQSAEPIAVATELVESFNDADWRRFRATLDPDVVYEETGTQRRIQGADAYVRLCQGWKEAFPDVRGAVRQAAASAQTVAQEVVWEGTHRGPLAGPGGTIPPSGKRVSVRGTMWYTVAEGRAREIHHHLDVLSMMQQLGALPAPAGAGV